MWNTVEGNWLRIAQLNARTRNSSQLYGTFGPLGSPRFTLFDFSGNSTYVYWGNLRGFTATDPNGGVFGNTDNYIGDSQVRYASNGFGGPSFPNSYEAYADLPICPQSNMLRST